MRSLTACILRLTIGAAALSAALTYSCCRHDCMGSGARLALAAIAFMSVMTICGAVGGIRPKIKR